MDRLPPGHTWTEHPDEGDRTCNPGICLDLESNPPPFGLLECNLAALIRVLTNFVPIMDYYVVLQEIFFFLCEYKAYPKEHISFNFGPSFVYSWAI